MQQAVLLYTAEPSRPYLTVSLKKEKDKESKKRLEDLRRELADLKEKHSGLKAQWDAEREAISKVRKLREEIEQLKQGVEAAERNYDLNKAAELRHGLLPLLEKKLADAEHAPTGGAGGGEATPLAGLGASPILSHRAP